MTSFTSISFFILGTLLGLATMFFILSRRVQLLIARQKSSQLDVAMLEERLRAKDRDVIEHASRIYHLDEVIDGLQKTVKLLTADKASLEVQHLPQDESGDGDTHVSTNDESSYLISRDF